MHDVSHINSSFVISDIFEYSKIVFASTTYNNSIFVKMENIINDVIHHNIQNRKIAIIENGSWACCCGDLIRDSLSKLKNITFIEGKINIKSSLKKSQKEDIENLAKELV